MILEVSKSLQIDIFQVVRQLYTKPEWHHTFEVLLRERTVQTKQN